MKIFKNGILSAVLMAFLVLFGAEDKAVAQGKGKGKKHKTSVKGGPPPWAPAHGYRAKTRYVFFRDYAVYYDHQEGVYISLAGKDWQISASLPVNLKGVDLNAAVKIDLEADGDTPQRLYYEHKKKFAKLN
ncbi:MAG: hypothetical protein P8X57_03365 [Cyclobacteriaceae bacterium]